MVTYNQQGANANQDSETTADFYRQIARQLMLNKGHQMTPGMAVLPGSWKYSVPDIITALSAGKYQKMARDADLNLRNPEGQQPPDQQQSGQQQSLLDKFKSYWQGGQQGQGQGQGQQQPQEELETGSNASGDQLPQYEGKSPEMDAMPNQQGGVQGTAIPPFQTDRYADEVKRVENPALYSGKVDTSKAQWDFQQHTNGFGTKALNSTEVIDRAESNKRFDRDWQAAGAEVDKFKPGLPPGTKAALQSLTFNSGTKWMNSGLGAAVQSGDQAKTRELFTQYNKATDARTGRTTELANLKDRRNREVKWMDDDNITGSNPQPAMPGRMNAGLGGVPPNPGEPSAVTSTGGKPFESSSSQQDPEARTNLIPGTNIPAPKVPYVETPQEIHSQMMRGSPSDAQKVMEDWRKRQQPYMMDLGPNGQVQITPKQGGGADYRMFPSPKTEQVEGVPIYSTLDKEGKREFKFMLPGGEERSFDSKSDALEGWRQLKEFKRTEGAKDITTQTGAQTSASYYGDKLNDITSKYYETKNRGDRLQQVYNIVNDPKFIHGTADQQRQALGVFMHTLGMNPPGEGADLTKYFVKEMSNNILDDIKSLGGLGLGQVRAKEMEVIQKMNADPSLPIGSIRAILKMAMKSNEQRQGYHDAAIDYASDHNDRLDRRFDRDMFNKLKDKPLLTPEEISNYKSMFKEDIELPSGNSPPKEKFTRKKLPSGATMERYE